MENFFIGELAKSPDRTPQICHVHASPVQHTQGVNRTVLQQPLARSAAPGLPG